MRASEWQFLCAVHESPKSCCAIDYCCHTLDWATNIVTSQKIFPSRLSLGDGDGIDGSGPGFKHLINIFRRLHRIFAHAWFQHRGVFWQVEGQTGLYVLFKTVCDNYDLLPAENYKLPPEAEGLEAAPEGKFLPTILKPENSLPYNAGPNSEAKEDQNFMSIGRTNTRRHIRSSPSTGSAVTTVPEADFEEDAGEDMGPNPESDSGDETDVLTLMKDMNISEQDVLQDEGAGVTQRAQEDEVQFEAITEADVGVGTDASLVVLDSNDDLEIEAEPELADVRKSDDADGHVEVTSNANSTDEPPNGEAVLEFPLESKDRDIAPEAIVHKLNVDHEKDPTMATESQGTEGDTS